jgi:serine/threonine-protein kinase
MPENSVLNGRYELHRRLARGGMADVFLARDQLLDRPVAVKVLFAEFATDPSFVARFRREAQAAANLTHPNIVSVYDWGEEGGTYFIVMEYVEGRSLAEILRAEGRLHPQRAADIAADIATALGFAHRNGVVHRDVKPGNVLISPTGQVKVADFGIARAVGSDAEDNLTQAGSVMGTATYFSPEQAQGLPLDPRSDLYALGVVLYEMVTGRPPFSGDSPVAIAYKHVQEQPVPPRQIDPEVPAALEAIILRLLAKNPADRYASAEDLRADLRRFREGLPVAATVAAGAGGAAGAAAPVAAAQATMAVPAYGGDGTTVVPAQDAGYEPPPRRRTGVFLVVLFVLLAALAALVFALAKALNDDNTPAVEQVPVPLVVGKTADEATTILTTAGFKVDRRDEKNDAPVNQVFAQEPAENANADRGSTVTIHVSQGPDTISMPSLVGKSEADARAILTSVGIPDANITTTTQPDDNAPAGQVIAQTPEAKAQVALDGQVQLVVSSGPAPRPVPDVSGKSVAEASNILGQQGFTVAGQTEEASDTVDSGKVIRTDPAAGSTQPKGAAVTLVVSTGPADVAVPNVIGMTEDDATTALEDAGFVVDSQDQTVTDPLEVGLVQDQDPAADSTAPPGSTVTIFVGRLGP